MEKVVEGSYHA